MPDYQSIMAEAVKEAAQLCRGLHFEQASPAKGFSFGNFPEANYRIQGRNGSLSIMRDSGTYGESWTRLLYEGDHGSNEARIRDSGQSKLPVLDIVSPALEMALERRTWQEALRVMLQYCATKPAQQQGGWLLYLAEHKVDSVADLRN